MLRFHVGGAYRGVGAMSGERAGRGSRGGEDRTAARPTPPLILDYGLPKSRCFRAYLRQPFTNDCSVQKK